MMKTGKLLLLICLIYFTSPVLATHIVGGGFDMVSDGNYYYKIRLILYFDEINGSSGAIDQDVTFNIFRKKDNVNLRQISVPLGSSDQIVDYVSTACGTTVPVRTRIFEYVTNIFLPPAEFGDPMGYYVMWERCCRNQGITNIRFPGSTGQTFFMDFPPVIKNGQPFLNDSPVFAPVGNNLFCINQLSKINFNAYDFDGDSLVYELTNPVRSIKADSIIPRSDIGTPGPYPSVIWNTDYGTSAQITGDPDLIIDSITGILSVKPNKLGLFVFAVKCSEFRNGVKIGEVRREFQQVVIDCPVNTSPKIFIRDPLRPRNIAKNDTLFISNTQQTTTCIQIKVTDLQIGQRITLKAIPLNFTPIAPITGDTTQLVTSDTVRLSFCLPACVGSAKENPYKLKVVARDNGCSGSLTDTFDVYVVLTVPPFFEPKLLLSSPDSVFDMVGLDSLKINVRTEMQTSQLNSLRAEYYDNRNRTISPNSFNPPMYFQFKSGYGSLSSPYQWKAPCNKLSNQPITVIFVAKTNFCNQSITLKKPIKISVSPFKLDPKLYVVGKDTGLSEIEITGKVNQPVNFDLEGIIKDKKKVEIVATSQGKLLQTYAINTKDSIGFGKVTSPLRWNPTCKETGLNYPFTVMVRAVARSCDNVFSDSLLLKFKLEEPDLKISQPPNFFTNNNDGYNDFLTLKTMLKDQECPINFQNMEVFNRWGEKVYGTSNPAFVWPENREESGSYFFVIRFKEKTFTGWFQMTN